MKSIEIENVKQFTTQLFAGTAFDDFLAVEATFLTAATFTIDGHINPGFLDEEQLQFPENQEGILHWKKLKAICFEIIKGKKVPQRFKIIFKMPKSKIEIFLRQSGLSVPTEQISGLFLNINYQGGKLYCTTGASLKIFTMDKSLENQWDEYMSNQLKKFA